MDVRGEGPVVALRSDRPVEQGVDRERVGLARLVGHLGRGLVDVDHRAVEVGEPHRHAGAGEEAGHVVHPVRRPVVVVRVEADAVLELDLRLRSPSRSTRCSGCGGSPGARATGTVAKKSASWVGDEAVQAWPGSSPAQLVLTWSADLEALRPAYCLAIASVAQRAGVEVRRSSGCTPSRRPSSRRGSPPRRPGSGVSTFWRAVVVGGHHDDGLLPPREVPEPRQRLLVHGSSSGSGSRAGAAARPPAGSPPWRGSPSRAARRPPWPRRTCRRSAIRRRPRRARRPPTPGCPGACRRSTARGRR